MCQHPHSYRPGLGLAHGARTGAVLRIASLGHIASFSRTPVFRIVPMQVESTDPIFVKLVVSVIVDSLGCDHPVTFPFGDAFHQTTARIAWIEGSIPLVLFGPNLPPNRVDDAIAIQVFWRVLIE